MAAGSSRRVGLLRLPSTKTGRRGERLIPLPSWAMTLLKRRRLAIGPGMEAVFPDSLGGWRDPSNVRRIWRQVRETPELDGLLTHTLRKTVATFLDDAEVSTRRISDQLGHAKVSMTQDRYLGRRLTDRQTAEVLERLFEVPRGRKRSQNGPVILNRTLADGVPAGRSGPLGDRTPNPRSMAPPVSTLAGSR